MTTKRKRRSDTPETDAAEFPVMTWPRRDNPLVVRATLARSLERGRNALAAYIERIAEDADGCGDEILAKQMRSFVAAAISENANALPTEGSATNL